MMNPMNAYVARKAAEQIAREQFSYAEQDAQPEQKHDSLIARLWQRRPFRSEQKVSEQGSYPVCDPAEAI
ncbi:MAG: hypothetical protein K8I60_02330 [Anaerolineae bacterium]|nr:hypothetical protein [Anaerolineae bacterium]